MLCCSSLRGYRPWGQCDSLFMFRLWFFPVSCHTEHGMPAPAFLKFDLGYVRVLCTFSNIFSSWDCQKLAAEQLLDRAGDIVSHGRRYKPPGTVQITPPPPQSSSYVGQDAVLGQLSTAFNLCAILSVSGDRILYYLPYFSYYHTVHIVTYNVSYREKGSRIHTSVELHRPHSPKSTGKYIEPLFTTII
jgi:hypothetical protein